MSAIFDEGIERRLFFWFNDSPVLKRQTCSELCLELGGHLQVSHDPSLPFLLLLSQSAVFLLSGGPLPRHCGGDLRPHQPLAVLHL